MLLAESSAARAGRRAPCPAGRLAALELARVRSSSALRSAISLRSAVTCLTVTIVLVAQVADPADDVGVVLLDPLQVLVAVDQIVEAVGSSITVSRSGWPAR